MIAGHFALMLTAAAAPVAAQSPAGMYQVQQMEMGGGLELRADGTFRYALEYGAASEQAEGKWAYDGRTVTLTSEPMPKAPAFELLRDDPAPKGEVWMSFDNAFQWTGRIDAIATAQGVADKGLVTTGSGGRVDSGGRVLTSIEPLVPVYATPGGVVPLSPDRGHRLLFRFHPNDLGKAAFKGEVLERAGTDLRLNRYDTGIRFVRVKAYKDPRRPGHGR
jgi:hypothetical protein